MNKFSRFFDSWLARAFFAYAMLAVIGNAISHSQPPAWLSPVSPPSAVPPPVAGRPGDLQGGNAEGVRARVITKVKYDTVTVVKTDTVVRIDTLHPPKPVYYIYTVYYEILDKKLSMGKSFSWDFSKTAQKTTLQSSDTTLLNLGNEVLRESSYTYDNNGNKTQTYEKLIEGLDMRISGKRANITYRTGSSLLSLDGFFDGFGLLQLSSDFSRRRYFLYFIPIDFLFGSEKYTLFLRVEKTEAR
jgi:hypothetical protein